MVLSLFISFFPLCFFFLLPAVQLHAVAGFWPHDIQ